MRAVLSIENALNWSWGIVFGRLAEALRYRYRFVRVIRVPNVAVSQDLVDYFPAALMQNVDNLGLVRRRKDKVITRMGGMVVDRSHSPRHYDAWLAQCGAVIATNAQLYAISRAVNGNTYLVPNPVDLQKFHPGPARRSWPAHGRRFTVGFAGNVWGRGGDYKGWQHYVQATLRLYGHVDKRECLHNGPSPQAQVPHDRMCEDFYWAIDCLILPSVNEGCSNVVGEALASGVPVLCTPVGYHGEKLTDGKNVLFIERDPDDIVAKVRRLMDDPELYASLAAAGRRFAEQHQDAEKIAPAYDRVIRSVLQRAG